MRLISGPGALPGGVFTEGNPATNTPATTLTAQWCNDVQSELVNLLLAAGLTPGAPTDQVAAAVRALAAGGGGSVGDKNAVINGDFAIMQRGNPAAAFPVTNASACTLDRWHARSDAQGSGAGTGTIQRIAHGQTQTEVPGYPPFFARYIQTVAATVAQPRLCTRLESVRRFASGSLTLSFYAKASAALSVVARLVQNFGSGGTGSAEVVVASSTVSVSSSGFGRHVVSVDLTAGGFTLAGKTIGNGGDDHLRVEFLLPQGATYTLEISDVQVEASPTATPFARRTAARELELCRRYYERTGPLDSFQFLTNGAVWAAVGADAQATSGFKMLASRFLVAKFGVPNMRWYSPASGAVDQVQWGTSNIAISGTTGATDTSTGYPSPASGPSTGQTNVLAGAHWTADADWYGTLT